MGLLTVLPANVASLFRLTAKQNEAIFWIYWIGIQRGYSFSNLGWIVKQMIHESGWQGSPLLNRNNNPFGMSCTNSTHTTQVGCEQLPDGNTNGRYKSIKAAVKDRFLWDAKRFTVPFEYRNASGYAEEVSERYFPQNPTGYYQAVGGVRYNPTIPLVIFGIFIPLELFGLYKLIR